jgi:hypothetical protein
MKLHIALLTLVLFLSACAAVDSSNKGASNNERSANTMREDINSDPINEALFHQWFGAEFNNHEQNWQDKIDLEKNPDLQVHEHIHHIFAPLPTPVLKGTTCFVKQYMDGDASMIYRQRLYQFVRNDETSLLELNIYRFKDENKFADVHLNPKLYQNLQLDELTNYLGCEVYWAYKVDDNNAGYFDGFMNHSTCVIVSQRNGKTIYFNDTLKFTQSKIYISDKAEDEDGNYVFGDKAGIAHKNRKVTCYQGWGGTRIGDQQADKDADWLFTRGLLLHSEGQIVPILDDKTQDRSGYSLQLALLTYQYTNDPIFKLGLIEDATGNTITYIWNDRANPTMDLNLRWMQTGLKKKQTRPHLSF